MKTKYLNIKIQYTYFFLKLQEGLYKGHHVPSPNYVFKALQRHFLNKISSF